MDRKKCVGIIIFTCICTLILIHYFGSIKVEISGAEFSLGIQISPRGATSISLPPLGVLKAYTHQIPVQLNVVLENIHLDMLKSIIDKFESKDELLLFLKKDITNALYTLSFKIIFLSLLGSFFTCIIFRLSKKQIFISFTVGFIVVVILLGSLYFTYDITAFDTPEYFGTLKAAPWIIGLLNKGISQINDLGQQIKNMSDNITTVFSKMDNLASTEKDSVVRVLHVSDIHNNTAAFDFMDQIIKNFNVDLVIDTGDITDYGTSLEDIVIKNISLLPVKYVFVAGNHDSPNTINILKNMENVVVLDGNMVNVMGIDILGFPDPGSNTADIDSPSQLELLDLNLSIFRWFWSSEKVPDILAVHNPSATENLAGTVPIILNGHTHKFSLIEKNHSLIINAGTTGAAGIRGLQSKNDIPYSAVLMYFREREPNKKPQLFAIDTIKISNYKAGFQVERMFFDQGSDFH